MTLCYFFTMKKIFIIMIILGLVFFGACSSDENKDNELEDNLKDASENNSVTTQSDLNNSNSQKKDKDEFLDFISKSEDLDSFILALNITTKMNVNGVKGDVETFLKFYKSGEKTRYDMRNFVSGFEVVYNFFMVDDKKVFCLIGGLGREQICSNAEGEILDLMNDLENIRINSFSDEVLNSIDVKYLEDKKVLNRDVSCFELRFLEDTDFYKENLKQLQEGSDAKSFYYNVCYDKQTGVDLSSNIFVNDEIYTVVEATEFSLNVEEGVFEVPEVMDLSELMDSKNSQDLEPSFDDENIREPVLD